MGKKIPQKLSFFRALYFCVLAVCKPSLLVEIEKQDAEYLNSAPADETSGIQVVRHAFWCSAILIILFGIVGVLAGLLLKYYVGVASQFVIMLLQILGASLLTWGTLFVRGFEIQSYSCATLGERVNQWLYRGMYCMGTAVVVCSLVWQQV